MVHLTVIGASRNWMPSLGHDILAVFPDPIEVRFADIEPKHAELCAAWGNAMSHAFGRHDRWLSVPDRREALREADGVIITISTGGLEAMACDIGIPEVYGIRATVGDTAGPGGWSRAIRNIPVFEAFAKDFREVCPRAFIANYTNPMSALTATLQLRCPNPVVGLCHSYFETLDLIQGFFGLPDWSDIAVSLAGMNHFSWMTAFTVRGQDGYALMREKISTGSLYDFLPETLTDAHKHTSGVKLAAELYDRTGYLTYPADRHICEFLSHTLYRPETGSMEDEGEIWETIEPWGIRRTGMATREKRMRQADARMTAEITGEKPAGPQRSRETGIDMIRAYLENKPMRDAVNMLNIGQIPGLPRGAAVETIGMVDGMGPRPMTVANVPEALLELMRPQAVNQAWLVEGMLERNPARLFDALHNDAQCAGMPQSQVKEMGQRLIAANRGYVGLDWL